MRLTREELRLRLDMVTNHLAKVAINSNISQSDVSRMISSIVERYQPRQLLTLLSTCSYIEYFEDMFKQLQYDEYRNQISSILSGLEQQIEKECADD